MLRALVVALLVAAAVNVCSAEESPEWEQYRKGISSLAVGGSTLADLSPVMDWKYSIPLQYVRRGQSFVGANGRLRRVMADMLAGKPVEVTVIGGSISTGAVASRKMAATNPNDVWSLVRLYMQENVSDKVSFYNNARSATKSYINSLCMDKFLNTTSQLVFIEFLANDGTEMDTSINSTEKAQSYERLLRKVLAQPNAPAVVLVQMLPNEMAFPPEGLDGKSKRNFAATPEDVYRNLAQYYDIPALSFRDATYQLGDGQVLGFSWESFMGPDRLHPNDLGHKVIADLVVYLLQQTAVGTYLQPISRAERSTSSGALPVAMYPGNVVGSMKQVCAMGPDLEKYVVTEKGWTLVKTKDKYATYGFETTTPGVPLTVEVNTAMADQRNASLSFTYTRAQKGYGGMTVTCDNGCTCDPQFRDGTLTYDQVVVFIDTVHPSGAPECHVSFTLASNSTAGSKLRVSGIAVNGDSGDIQGRIGEEKYMAWLTGTEWAA